MDAISLHAELDAANETIVRLAAENSELRARLAAYEARDVIPAHGAYCYHQTLGNTKGAD